MALLRCRRADCRCDQLQSDWRRSNDLWYRKHDCKCFQNFAIDAALDTNIDADGGNIPLQGRWHLRFDYALGATNTITTTGAIDHDVSGAYTVDAGGAITLDATGTLNVQDEGTTAFGYTLDPQEQTLLRSRVD